MPKVTIDGVEIEVADGTTVLNAALSMGKEIPHYCYHPGLSISGNCRMCLVEVENAPKLLIGCSTQVTDGMVVHTESDRVKAARASVQEFLLVNHPLDCPICDQAGECRLQEYAVEHGDGVSRYSEPKLALSKAVDIGRHVTLDQERCIQCSRCIRFCDEVTGTGELDFFQRGSKSQIGIHPGHRLDNPYSGNVVDLCPVGALTLKEFRFQARVWYLKDTPSVCSGCSRGCNVIVGVSSHDHYQLGDIRRVTARSNPDVNGHWICDEGRLSYLQIRDDRRLATAEADGQAIAWDEAAGRAAASLRAAAREGKLGAILSPRLTTEEMYAWRKLFMSLGDVKVGIKKLIRGEDDDLLIRADRGANSRGAEWLYGTGATEEHVHLAIRSGGIDTVLIVGDPLVPEDTADLDDNLRADGLRVVFVGPLTGGAAEHAGVRLPSAAWGEQDGTTVNFENRIQRLRKTRTPKQEARPGWRVVVDLAEAAGVEFPDWTSFDDVLAAVAADVRAYEGVDADAVGMLGVRGKVEAPAGT